MSAHPPCFTFSAHDATERVPFLM